MDVTKSNRKQKIMQAVRIGEEITERRFVLSQ